MSPCSVSAARRSATSTLRSATRSPMPRSTAAWDAGIRVFDTAPFYGLGLSEERFGPRPRRNTPATPMSSRPRSAASSATAAPEDVPKTRLLRRRPRARFDFDYSYDGVMRSHADSLKRMNVDRIDILLVHDLDIFIHRTAEERGQARPRAVRQRRLSRPRGAAQRGNREGDRRRPERMAGLRATAELGDFDCFLLAEPLHASGAGGARKSSCRFARSGTSASSSAGRSTPASSRPARSRARTTTTLPRPPDIVERVRKIEAVCRAHGVKLGRGGAAIRARSPGGQDGDPRRERSGPGGGQPSIA